MLISEDWGTKLNAREVCEGPESMGISGYILDMGLCLWTILGAQDGTEKWASGEHGTRLRLL